MTWPALGPWPDDLMITLLPDETSPPPADVLRLPEPREFPHVWGALEGAEGLVVEPLPSEAFPIPDPTPFTAPPDLVVGRELDISEEA